MRFLFSASCWPCAWGCLSWFRGCGSHIAFRRGWLLLSAWFFQCCYLREFLFQLEHGFEQVAHFLHAFQDLIRREDQQLRIFVLQAVLHFLPGNWGGYGWLFFSAQGIDADRGFEIIVLAPIYKHLVCPERLLHIGDHAVGIARLQERGDGFGKGLS